MTVYAGAMKEVSLCPIKRVWEGAHEKLKNLGRLFYAGAMKEVSLRPMKRVWEGAREELKNLG